MNNPGEVPYWSACAASVVQLLAVQAKADHIHPLQKSAVVKAVEQGGALSYAEFRAIPALCKEQAFEAGFVAEAMKKVGETKLVPAAGTSSTLLAFRVVDPTLEARQFANLQGMLQKLWGIGLDQCCLINAYPTGINLPDTLFSVETSAKPEVIKQAMDLAKACGRTIVLACQPHLLKYCAIHGYIEKCHAPHLRMLIGGTSHVPSLFNLLEKCWEVPKATLWRHTVNMYGIAEAGLGIGMGFLGQHAWRAAASTVASYAPLPVPTALMVDTNRFFVESVEGQVVVTRLDAQSKLPLIRYHTGDSGAVWGSGADLPGGGLSGPALTVAERVPPGSVVAASAVEDAVHEAYMWPGAGPGTFSISTSEVKIDYDSGATAAVVQAYLAHISAALGGNVEVRPGRPVCKKDFRDVDLFRKPRPYGGRSGDGVR